MHSDRNRMRKEMVLDIRSFFRNQITAKYADRNAQQSYWGTEF